MSAYAEYESKMVQFCSPECIRSVAIEDLRHVLYFGADL